MPRASLRATTLLALAVAGAFLWQLSRVTVGFEHWTLESRRQAEAAAGSLKVGALRLRDADGHEHIAFAPADGGGRSPEPVRLVDFMYTRCETVCSALGSEFQQMQQRLAAVPDRSVQLLSVSIAPGQDDAQALYAYASRHGARADAWLVAAPQSEAESIHQLRDLGIVVLPDGQGGFVHNGDIHLIDGQGRVRGIWPYAEWGRALEAAQAIGHRP